MEVWPLRAERQKEPRLNPPIPKKRQAPTVDKRTIQEDTQTLDEAISALKEALYEPPPPPQPKARPRKSRPPENKSSVALQRQQTLEQPLEQPEKPRAPEFGETLLFWKEYDSKPYEQKGLPAWHEDSQTPRGVTPVPVGSPRVAVPASPRPVVAQSRDWGKEAAVQRRVVAREHADWPGNFQLSVDFEVHLRSKERLRHMLRTGQKERVKKELAASLPLVVEQDEEPRPSVKLDSSLEEGQTKRLKKARESKERQGNAAEALRMMTLQRNELLKARRALEQVVDRRRESDKIMDKLKQVLAKYKKPKPAVDSAIADAIHEQFHLRERSAIDKA